MICPNCAQTVDEGRLICPHCGAFITPTTVRPPVVGSVAPGPQPLPERLLTGRRGLDFGLGFVPPPVLAGLFVVGYGEGNEWLTVGAGALFLTTLVLCAALRRRCPVVARGLAWGLIAIPLLLVLGALGAFAVCLYSVFNASRPR